MDEELNKNEKLRLIALDRAIEAGAGTAYNDMALLEIDANKIVEAAKKFEAYLKGE